MYLKYYLIFLIVAPCIILSWLNIHTPEYKQRIQLRNAELQQMIEDSR